MHQTTQIVERATVAAKSGKSVLVLITSDMQKRAMRSLLPASVHLDKKVPDGKKFDLVLDDR